MEQEGKVEYFVVQMERVTDMVVKVAGKLKSYFEGIQTR